MARAYRAIDEQLASTTSNASSERVATRRFSATIGKVADRQRATEQQRREQRQRRPPALQTKDLDLVHQRLQRAPPGLEIVVPRSGQAQ